MFTEKEAWIRIAEAFEDTYIQEQALICDYSYKEILYIDQSIHINRIVK